MFATVATHTPRNSRSIGGGVSVEFRYVAAARLFKAVGRSNAARKKDFIGFGGIITLRIRSRKKRKFIKAGTARRAVRAAFIGANL